MKSPASLCCPAGRFSDIFPHYFRRLARKFPLKAGRGLLAGLIFAGAAFLASVPAFAQTTPYTGGDFTPGTQYVVDSDVSDDVSLSGPGEVWLTVGERVTFDGAISLDSGESLYVTAADNKLHQDYREINVDGGRLYVAPSSGLFKIENSDSITLSNGGQIILLPKDAGNAVLQFRLVGVTLGDYDSGVLPLNFTDGLVSNPGGTIYLGANSKTYSNNSMEAAWISLMDAAVLQEGALIVVDGKGQALTDASGKTYYTYAHINMEDGSLYEGNVIVELADEGFAEYGGVAINGGLFRGDIEVRSGRVTFRRGGKLDGRLIIAGGKVELLSSQGDAQLDDAEANITGGIEFAAGNLSIESGEGLYMDGDIRIQVGSSINAAGASLGTARTLYMEGGSLEAGTFEAAAIEMSSGSLAAGQANVSGNSVVSGGAVEAERLTVAGSALVSGEGTRLTLSGGSGATSSLNGLVVKNGAEAEIDCLEMASGGDVQVGDAADTAGGSTVSFGHLNLNGGMLTVDPAWGLEPSNVAVENLSASHSAADSVTINGSVGVGRNSYLAIGTSDTAWLPGKVEEATGGAGLSDGNVESALGLYKPLTVSAGETVVVDGGLDNAALQNTISDPGEDDSVVFAGDSLLVLNGADAAMQGGTPAISFENANGGSVEVKNDARLLITDAVDGASYKISEAPIKYEGGSYAATTAWKNENLLTSSAMVSLQSLGEGGVFVASINAPASVYPDLSAGMSSALTTLYTGVSGSDYADVNSSSHGVRFLSRGSDTRYLPAEQTARTLEGAARLSSAGAAPALGMLAAEGAAQAVRNRLDYGSHVVIAPIRHPDAEEQTGYASGDDPNIGLNVWATPIYQNSRARDLKAEKLEYGYDINLGGLAIGADYTFENKVRAGISLNAGGGRAESHGDFNHTENDMNFWGLGAYLAWHQGNFGLLLDTALTFTDNELEQSLPASMGMDKLKADVRARVYQAGAHAEYTIETELADITPHVGVRYMNVDVHNYDVKSGETVMYADDSSANIWTFPVGVTLSTDFVTEGGWQVSPQLDLSVIPAAGDTSEHSNVSFVGLPGVYGLEIEMLDEFSVRGSAGLELARDNLSLGLNYTLQAGEHVTSHNVMGVISYSF